MLQNKVGEQRLYRLFGRFSLLYFFSIGMSLLHAESFAEFKKSQSDTFTTYLDQSDKTFEKYLRSNWEEYTSHKASPLYTQPKPEKIIFSKKIRLKARGPLVHIRKIDSKEQKGKAKLKTVNVKSKKDIEFDFFGSSLGFTLPSGIQEAKFYPQSKKGINNFFNTLVGIEYEVLLSEIKQKSFELNLNDWGKYLLIKRTSEKIFSNQNDSRLLEWFLFNKLGYSLRVGLANKHIIVMYESKKIIYNTPRYTINKKNFYIVSEYASKGSEKIFTYKQNHPEANKLFDLSMESLPNLEKNLKIKKLTFRENMKKYAIEYRYNQNLIDFMATYPQADYETFFNAPLQEESYQDIVNGLRKYINGKKSSNAINFVLHFVQNAFKYEVDMKQFAREKVMFADETLFYNKSDCEDRAILFARLVKDIFKIAVVGVQYNDHMTTALHIPIKGDTVRVNSRKYVIADPTFKYASIGQNMNKYKLKRPKRFIFLK